MHVATPSPCQLHDHVAQFYEDEAALADRVVSFLTAGITAGERLLMLLTPARRRDVLARLEAWGLDTAAAEASGQLVVHDAEMLLEAIMDGDMPDEARFNRHVLAEVEAATPRPTRAFGELVDVLCARGQSRAAVRLETLWHAACGRLPLTLLCGYALHHFRKPGGSEAFAAVCELHSWVVPVGEFSALPPACQLREVARLQQEVVHLRQERERTEQTLEAVQSLCSEVLAELVDRTQHDGLANHRYAQQRLVELLDDEPDSLALRAALCEALPRGEFELYFRPRICAVRGQVVAVSAQPRWYSTCFGVMEPAHWIAAVEAADQVGAISGWVLDGACEHAQAWLEAGVELRVAVQVITADLLDGEFAERVAAALTTGGLPGEMLELELTEDVLMHAPARAEMTLARLKALGVHLSVAEFGRGHSILGHLDRFPVDAIKLPASFVEGCLDSPHHQAIIRSVVMLAHKLGIRVIASGVATRGQADYLREQGCDYLEGPLWSRMEYRGTAADEARGSPP